MNKVNAMLPVTAQPSVLPEKPTGSGISPQQKLYPGLDYLAPLTQIVITQKRQFSWSCVPDISFSALDPDGQELLLFKFVGSCAEFCTSCACEMTGSDSDEKEVIRFVRKFGLCRQSLDVQAPAGQGIGRVTQTWSFCRSAFIVTDENGTEAYYIEGLGFHCAFGQDIHYKIFEGPGSSSGKEVGNITKKWRGFTQELSPYSNKFLIEFPVDADAKMKAVLVGAGVLLGLMLADSGRNQ